MTTIRDALLADILANPADDMPRLVYADLLDEQGEGDRAEFIRLQIERLPDNRLLSRASLEWGNNIALATPGFWEFLGCQGKSMNQRQQAVFEALAPGKGSGLKFVYQRGFLAEVRCTQVNWLAHGPAIVQQYPIEQVTLTDVKPVHHDREPGFPCWTFAGTSLDRRLWGLLGRRYFKTEDEAKAAVSYSLILLAKGL